MAKKRTKKADKPNADQGNKIAQFTKELWQAAVNLRGSIEPADYKRYVLPIIFLRFLSLRYEKRREELQRLISDPSSDYFTDDPEVARDILEDPDEYLSANVFVVPEEARWENIVRQAQADDIKIRLDTILENLEKAYPEKLKGLLPRIYAGSNLSADNVRGLINLFSKDIFRQDHGGEDLIGRVYEYFIGEFASSEGKRGGEYFTPKSIVRLLVKMLEPTHGVVFDPCCGSGGMFVQSDLFDEHQGHLSFYGEESKDFTYRFCRMNLFIHGIDGKIELGNSYWNDRHPELKADYLLVNPPFNDGSKGENGWGADKLPNKDPRLWISSKGPMPLAPRNANPMWMMHFLYHLKEGGKAGFVMATGKLSNGETSRKTVRETLVEEGFVDCIVQLTGQLFHQTQIPCSLWFLSKGRDGKHGERKRQGKILFIDGRNLGSLIPGSRKQKELSGKETERVAAVYREYRHRRQPEEVPGFCRVANIEEVQAHNYMLTPGRYVGAPDAEEDGELFDEKMQRLTAELNRMFVEADQLADQIKSNLGALGLGR